MAKLPCIPQSRIFTLKETGETMSYDQVRQYLMSNPELWLGGKEGKEVAMPKAPYVQEVIPPINEEQAAGEKEMEALKKGDKITTTNPMRLLKGIYGKRNIDGSIRSAHTGVNGIFSSITEKIARRYEGEEGVVVFEIPAGVTVETVEIANTGESKGTPISTVRQMETDAINASDAQVVKLITFDSRGRESQYIIKDPALRKIGYKPSQREAEATNTPKDIASRIRNKKQKGALSAIDFGISVTIYNGALEFMAAQVEKGTKLGNAIANTIKWIDDKMKGEKWNKGAFGKYMNDTYKVTLGDGREVEVVRDDSKETAEVINGWYRPIEQKVLDSKEESLPANKWAERLKSKEDEDLWTGVRAFLEEKGTERVSRQELLDFVKDNRIEIVTVVKGEGYVVRDTKADKDIKEFDDYEEAVDFVLEQKKKGNDYSVLEKDKNKSVKFEQYQLPGDKENYKEVLVTLPIESSNFRKAAKEYFSKVTEREHYRNSKVKRGLGESSLAYFNRAKKELESDEKFQQLTKEEEALNDRYRALGERQQGDVFHSSHFDEPNILVHLRMNTRTDADGNKVLFLEEVQSDWGQQGKKEGFGIVGDFDKSKIKTVKVDERFGKTEVYYDGKNIDTIYSKSDTEAMDKATQVAKSYYDTAILKTPTAPFVMDTNAWVKLGLKTALKEAVAQGADKIAWTTGEQQNDRYDLSKQVEYIDYWKNDNGTYGFSLPTEFTKPSELTASELENYLGKEVAKKIVEDASNPTEDKPKRLQGDDLKVGGKGMKGFYGSPSEGNLGIIGGVAEKLFGQKVGDVRMKGEPKPVFKIEDRSEPGQPAFAVIDKTNPDEVLTIPETRKEAEDWIKKEEKRWAEKFQKYTQSSISITPELKAQVEKGLPLFGTEQQDAVVKFLRAQRSDPNILGLNAGLWNGLLTVIEKAWLASKSASKAIQAGIKWLKEQKEDPKEWEKYLAPVRERLQKTEAEQTEKKPASAAPTREKKEAAKEGEEVKERKTITSIKGLGDISDSVKEALFGEDTRYTVLPNQVSVREANAILQVMGDEKAKALVLNGDENIPDTFRVTLGEILIKKFNSEGKYKDAVDVAEGVAREATGWGQAIQALSLIKFLTPEGQLLFATRNINAVRDKMFKKHEGQMDRVKEAFQKADEEAIEGAINAVVTQTEEIPAPQVTRPKTWGEKNTIITKAVYEAAKRALKKFAFTGVPPELITIAAYHMEAGARSFADFSKEMVKDFGRKVRPYLRSAYKAAQKQVGGKGYSTDKEITAHLATEIDKDIKEVMKESGIKIRDLIKQHYSESERTKEALTKTLVDKLGLEASDAALIAAKVEAEYNKLATDKKARALKAIERRLTRKSPVRKRAEDKLIELSNLGAFDEGKFKEEYARAMGFPEITEKDAAKIKELAEKVQNAKEGRPKQNAIINLLNYQANLPGVDKMDLATSLWMASLLSGPSTQLKNIFANSYNMGALALNVAMQSPKDIPFLLRGLTIGLGNGLQEGGSTIVTGQSPIRQAAAAQSILERTKFSAANPFGYYKYVPRFMLAADAVTYGGLKEMRAYQLALSEARDKYPTENAVQKAIEILAQTDAQLKLAQAEAEQEYQEALAEIEADTSLSKLQKAAKKKSAILDRARRVYDIVEQNRPNQLVTDSHEFALRGTFNNPPDGALGVAAKFFNAITHKVPAVRFFVPFVNVITNVANEYVNYSPLGYYRAAKGGSITGNRKNFTEQDRKELMIKATIGSTAAIAAFVLSGIGADEEDEEPMFEITADGYNDYKKNKELEMTGWRPYSIRIGNTWVSYKLTPMAAILAGVGALRDREKYGKEKLTENALNKLIIPFQEFMSTTAETSFLGSAETFLSGVLGATKGDKGQKLTEWASKTGTSLIPVIGTNLYQQMAEKVNDALDIPDKEYKGVDGAIGIFAKTLRNIPVIRSTFKNAVNGLGEELPPQTSGLIYSKKEAGPHAKLWQLLADKKATTGRPDRRGAAYIDINGNEKAMNDEQFYLFAKTRGEYIRTLMEKQYSRLKEMDDAEFGEWMQNARSSANRFANGELALKSEGGIYEKGIKKYQAEADHEKERLMYALEREDVKDAKAAFDNYEPLSTATKGKDKKAIFVEIVGDDIIPSGINKSDKIDFYKAVFLNQNPTIRIQQKQANGKVKLIAKPFNQIFTEEEKVQYKKMYEQKEEDVASKLSVLDQAVQKKYADKMAGEAVWRKYLKAASK